LIIKKWYNGYILEDTSKLKNSDDNTKISINNKNNSKNNDNKSENDIIIKYLIYTYLSQLQKH